MRAALPEQFLIIKCFYFQLVPELPATRYTSTTRHCTAVHTRTRINILNCVFDSTNSLFILISCLISFCKLYTTNVESCTLHTSVHLTPSSGFVQPSQNPLRNHTPSKRPCSFSSLPTPPRCHRPPLSPPSAHPPRERSTRGKHMENVAQATPRKTCALMSLTKDYSPFSFNGACT